MIQIDIPMPDSCYDCPLNYDFCWCRGVEAGDNRNNEWPSDFDFSKQPDWCPLKEQPDIVRCKNCKHGRLYEENSVDCELNELAKDADWFCADGEHAENAR